MGDRRNPDRQRPIMGGERKTDPPSDDWLTTRQCATRLGLTTPEFIVGEILDGRLCALVIERPGMRRIYRVKASALQTYISRYSWVHK